MGLICKGCEPFQCNTMFKCQRSYCLPWSYIWDGKWDCPEGDDERRNPVCSNKINCLNMYKCRYKKVICLELGNICDSERNCPAGDDEMFCQLTDQICPSTCQCLLLAVRCRFLNFNFKEGSYFLFNVFVSVDISNSNLYSLVQMQGKLTQILRLSRNNIKEICFSKILKNVLHCDLSFNLIQDVAKNCFSYSKVLSTLILKNNNIFHLSTESFYNLVNLKLLDLSNNPLNLIPNHSFKNLPQLSLLNIKSSFHKTIGLHIFSKHKVKCINTKYKLLCLLCNTS